MNAPHYLLNWDLHYHPLQLVTQPPMALLLLLGPLSIHRDPNGLSVSHSLDPRTHCHLVVHMNTGGHTGERVPSSMEEQVQQPLEAPSSALAALDDSQSI